MVQMSVLGSLPIIVNQFVSEPEFVGFWSSRYLDPRAHLYSNNIGKRLTSRRVLELFEWKNGGPIAAHKLESIRRNYIQTRPLPPKIGDRDDHIQFITQPGGAIWRIFWLHCRNPTVYPIFDQHVFRAMAALVSGTPMEIPQGNMRRAEAYLDEYLPFHAGFSHPNKKQLDEALWSYGKYLKGRYVA